MKKFLTVLLSLLICSLCACGTQSGKTAEKDKANRGSSGTGEKISGTITAMSLYSDGVCFACTEEEENKTFCIDHKGNILFTLDEKLGKTIISETFTNGYAFIKEKAVGVDDYAVDKSGKIIRPQDHGVTKFYSDALEEGYILASRTTASYDSTKQEMGIMDLEFHWVVEPNEQLYNDLISFSSGKDHLPLWEGSFRNYAHDKKLYLSGENAYLDLQTGTIEKNIPDSKMPIQLDENYRNKIDLSKYDHAMLPENNAFLHFENGYDVLSFYNDTAKKAYFTLIDENGKFLFDPVECGEKRISRAIIEGETVLLSDEVGYFDPVRAVTYTKEGKKIAENTFEGVGNWSVTMSDGIIQVWCYANNISEYQTYTTDFTRLL